MDAERREELKFLESRRDRLFKGDPDFKAGDIVYDDKNQEFSIVMGLVDRSGTDFNDTEGEISSNPTILLLTKDYDNDSATRVRYTRKNRLTKLEDFKGISFSKNDLKTFCDSQCIQDCSEDCILWKYKKI